MKKVIKQNDDIKWLLLTVLQNIEINHLPHSLYLNQGLKISFIHLITYTYILYRNLDWLYSTPAGRQQIISNAKYTTVAFIYLQSDQEYRDLDQVKSEMKEPVIDFKPVHITNNIQVEKNIYSVRLKKPSFRFHFYLHQKALVKS
jgi:hypothetical protein